VKSHFIEMSQIKSYQTSVPDLEKRFLGFKIGTKQRISVTNQAQRTLFVAVTDDQNAQILMQANLRVGSDGAGGGFKREFARVQHQLQILHHGCTAYFEVGKQGNYGNVWVSDDKDFPRDLARTPYQNKRMKIGSDLRVHSNRFDGHRQQVQVPVFGP
jgi:hypothetical protein